MIRQLQMNYQYQQTTKLVKRLNFNLNLTLDLFHNLNKIKKYNTQQKYIWLDSLGKV
jgi:hypothetical protein